MIEPKTREPPRHVSTEDDELIQVLFTEEEYDLVLRILYKERETVRQQINCLENIRLRSGEHPLPWPRTKSSSRPI